MSKVWHIVLFQTTPRVTPEQIDAVRTMFTDCVGQCEGLEWVEAGSNTSASAFARGWTEAVVMQFRDRRARDAYLVHPLHEAASARTRQGFYSALAVFDMDVPGVPGRKERR